MVVTGSEHLSVIRRCISNLYIQYAWIMANHMPVSDVRNQWATVLYFVSKAPTEPVSGMPY